MFDCTLRFNLRHLYDHIFAAVSGGLVLGKGSSLLAIRNNSAQRIGQMFPLIYIPTTFRTSSEYNWVGSHTA